MCVVIPPRVPPHSFCIILSVCRYVARLKLIAVDFYRVVVGLNQTKTVISDLCVKMIFLNIQSIYAFHQELLQSLSDMLAKWYIYEVLQSVCLPHGVCI